MTERTAARADTASNGGGRNLAQRLVDEIIERIRSGTLMPGMKLPTESELAAEFGVSRTVVREAASRLKAAGLVESQQGRGTFVLMMPADAGRSPLTQASSSADVADLLGFRMGIEGEAAALAAAHATEDQRYKINTASERFGSCSPHSSASHSADFDFHLAISQASRNRYFPELLEDLGPAMIAFPAYRVGAANDDDAAAAHSTITREHEAIARAVAEGDADTARAAMRLHLANSRHRILDHS